MFIVPFICALVNIFPKRSHSEIYNKTHIVPLYSTMSEPSAILNELRMVSFPEWEPEVLPLIQSQPS